jgi:hypothetical protein
MNILQTQASCKPLKASILRPKYPQGGRGVPPAGKREGGRDPQSTAGRVLNKEEKTRSGPRQRDRNRRKFVRIGILDISNRPDLFRVDPLFNPSLWRTPCAVAPLSPPSLSPQPAPWHRSARRMPLAKAQPPPRRNCRNSNPREPSVSSDPTSMLAIASPAPASPLAPPPWDVREQPEPRIPLQPWQRSKP